MTPWPQLRFGRVLQPGTLVNLVVRFSIIYFLGEVLLFPEDPRFAGKAIPIRNLVIVLSFGMLFPLMYALRWHGQGRSYPAWLDSLYLSIFWLDMAGNSFNLYDSYYYFDLIPHFHGPGALAAALAGAFKLSPLGAIGITNTVHTLLEGQEYYTDLFAATHNVRGVGDTVNDLLAGLVGAFCYIGVYVLLTRGKRSGEKAIGSS